MTTTKTRPRLTSFAPQLLVDDLARSIAYYEKLGFAFGDPWEGFYAIGELDGLELHLKEAPKSDDARRFRRESEHLDAAEIEFLRWRAERWMKLRHFWPVLLHSPWFVVRHGHEMLAHTFRGVSWRSLLGLESEHDVFDRYKKIRRLERKYL